MQTRIKQLNTEYLNTFASRGAKSPLRFGSFRADKPAAVASDAHIFREKREEGRMKRKEGVDSVAGAAGACAGLLRGGREAARGHEAGAAARTANS